MHPLQALRWRPASLLGLLPLTLLTGVLLAERPARAADPLATAGGKGAQLYCFMRKAGNSHEVSWIAAYALIKRQSDGLFKTSPDNAAVMIAETVVQNQGSFPDCGRYLGSLFERTAMREAAAAAAAANAAQAPAAAGTPARGTSRYSY